MIDVFELNRILEYNEITGVFIWRVGRCAGKIAGCKSGDGLRWQINIKGKVYQAHRLAWLLKTGAWPKEIDHKDVNGLNNSWCNLREATRHTNLANTRLRRRNTTGFKGVSVHSQTKKFIAFIKTNGKSHNLGSFSTPELAHEAYQVAAIVAFGEFARFR